MFPADSQAWKLGGVYSLQLSESNVAVHLQISFK